MLDDLALVGVAVVQGDGVHPQVDDAPAVDLLAVYDLLFWHRVGCLLAAVS